MHDTEHPRADPFGDALDGPALAGRITPFEHNADLCARGFYPLLELDQLLLQWLQLALEFLGRHGGRVPLLTGLLLVTSEWRAFFPFLCLPCVFAAVAMSSPHPEIGAVRLLEWRVHSGVHCNWQIHGAPNARPARSESSSWQAQVVVDSDEWSIRVSEISPHRHRTG